ncbi:MAG: diaminopimelate decarboxylase [Phycisphaerae bacterium]|jgi:diaminopimelate decarboxylase
MDYFEYRQGALHCEGVAVADIAAAVGTPVYIYSAATLLHHYRAMAQAFAELKPTICFSIKSLANLHLLKLLAAEGSGFDVVSGGELFRAMAVGADPARIAFAGVGKTDKEIREAIAAGVGLFNIESEAEFENLSRLAASAGKTVRAALRVNPDVWDPQTHSYTATGKKESKFGVDIQRAVRFFRAYGRDAHVRLDGIHLHIGSPIYSAEPYVQAITKALELIAQLREEGFTIALLDIGGGFAADYEEAKSPQAALYARQIVPLLRGRGLEIVMEPGRQVGCNAGLLLTEVQYIKEGADRQFVIVDAAMTDLIRPALYGAQHVVYPARLADGAPVPPRRLDFVPSGGVKVDIVGGVCESSDFLAKDRILPPMRRGDLLAVFSAGAYGFVMSSQYNSRPRAAEVLVEGDKWRIIRRRETYEDLLGPETQV